MQLNMAIAHRGGKNVRVKMGSYSGTHVLIYYSHINRYINYDAVVSAKNIYKNEQNYYNSNRLKFAKQTYISDIV